MRGSIAVVNGKMVEALVIKARLEYMAKLPERSKSNKIKTENSRVNTKSFLKYEKINLENK